MRPSTKQSLETFASQIYWGVTGHPEDLERFWDFVITAYRNGDKEIDLDEFLAVINGKDKAERPDDMQFAKRRLGALMYLFNKYEDGIKLLENYDHS